MKRRFRLTKSTDFERVRRFGKSHAHPLIVLIALPNEDGQPSQVGVAAGRSVGNAVRRNRAKRLLRAAIHPHLAALAPGWSIILLARHQLAGAEYPEVQAALLQLLRRARLLSQGYDEYRSSSS